MAFNLRPFAHQFVRKHPAGVWGRKAPNKKMFVCPICGAVGKRFLRLF
jgi:hypothetical protein